MKYALVTGGQPRNRAGCLCETGPYGLPRVGQLCGPDR